MPRARNVEEEDAVLVFEHAQQTAAGEHFLVRREVAVMRFVADVSRWRKRNRLDDLPIHSGVLIEIHHGEEVGRVVRLVAGPDVEHGFWFVASMLGKRIWRRGSCQGSKT